MNWRRTHWIVGTATLVIFLLSGAYMRWIRGVPDLDDVTRADGDAQVVTDGGAEAPASRPREEEQLVVGHRADASELVAVATGFRYHLQRVPGWA